MKHAQLFSNPNFYSLGKKYLPLGFYHLLYYKGTQTNSTKTTPGVYLHGCRTQRVSRDPVSRFDFCLNRLPPSPPPSSHLSSPPNYVNSPPSHQSAGNRVEAGAGSRLVPRVQRRQEDRRHPYKHSTQQKHNRIKPAN